jgi:transcription antitermination factor NusG
MKNWYALYLRSRFEKKTFYALQKKGIETYLPLIKEVHIWSDRKKKVEEPLFKGYIFVKTDLHDKEIILKTDGVIRFVGIKNKPSAIQDDQINCIKIVLHSSNVVQRESYPSIGEQVEVVAGSLRGIRGIVSEARGKTKLVILVDTISQAFSIEVQPEFLKVIN